MPPSPVITNAPYQYTMLYAIFNQAALPMQASAHSQEPLRITRLPLRQLRTTHSASLPAANPARPTLPSSHLTQRGHRSTPVQPTATAPLHPQSFPTLEFALESKHLLFLLSHFSFCALCLQLALTIRALQLINSGQQRRNLVSRFVDILN